MLALHLLLFSFNVSVLLFFPVRYFALLLPGIETDDSVGNFKQEAAPTVFHICTVYLLALAVSLNSSSIAESSHPADTTHSKYV